MKGACSAGDSEAKRDGTLVFGPSPQAARLETSKGLFHEFAHAGAIPTATSRSFSDLTAAQSYLGTMTPPYVIKADGPARRCGVRIEATFFESLHTPLQNLGTRPARLHCEHVNRWLLNYKNRTRISSHSAAQSSKS
jgi:phosphoribosylamine-glycine ligase